MSSEPTRNWLILLALALVVPGCSGSCVKAAMHAAANENDKAAKQAPPTKAPDRQTKRPSSQASTQAVVGTWNCKAESKGRGGRVWVDDQITYTKYHTRSSKGTMGFDSSQLNNLLDVTKGRTHFGGAKWEIVTQGRWRMKKGKLCERSYSCKSRALNDPARRHDRAKGELCSKEEVCWSIAVSTNTMKLHNTDLGLTNKCTRR
jgi:hypothetical protein